MMECHHEICDFFYLGLTERVLQSTISEREAEKQVTLIISGKFLGSRCILSNIGEA